MPIRVLFVNTRDRVGADVAVHLSLMRHAADEGVDAWMVANRHSLDRSRLADQLGADAQTRLQWAGLGMSSRGGFGRIRAGLASVEWGVSLGRLAHWVRSRGIDIVHATDRPRDAVSAVVLGRMAGVPSVVHMHSNPGLHLAPSTRWALENATCIVAISEFVRRGLLEMGVASDRITVVPNGVDPTWFDPTLAAGTGRFVRARHGIARDAMVLCQVARINPWKGQRETIAALAQVARRGWRPTYLLVGTGPRREIDALRRFAIDCGVGEQLVLAGHQDDVRPYLDASDVFVHPSHDEPFGLAIAEAMAMAKPVIACDSGGVPEMATDGRDAILVAPRSSAAVAHGLARLRALPDRGATLGRAARATVCAGYTPRHAARAAAGMWSRLCRNVGAQIPGNV